MNREEFFKMTSLFSSLMTIILFLAVIFAVEIFIKTIQEDIKEFKEKYQSIKKMFLTLKESNTYFK